jgi:halogenation protein CepH
MERFDAIVVGGGPAGSTTAGLLATQGRRVLVLEKEKFPRYHIGESLVPGIVPILEDLRVLEKVEAFGFVRKFGVTLLWGHEAQPWTVRFGEAGPFDHAYEVERSKFDDILLHNARHLGATVMEDACVNEFLFEDDRCAGVRYTLGRGGDEHEARARFVVDATGQSNTLARRLGVRRWQEDLKNSAVWAYFQGGRHYEGIDAGNILVENMPDGWLWVIPLQDGTQSVGFVKASAVNPSGSSEGGKASGRLLLEKIQQSVETKRLLETARRVSGFRTARDWSYTCSRMHGPGFLLVGDAAGFVDPLFSTGVFLAMNGGNLAAAAIDRTLDLPEREHAIGVAYQRAYKEFLDTVISFVRFFYDASKDKEVYWDKAQELVDPIGRMTARADFILMISGLSGVRTVMDLDEEIIDSPDEDEGAATQADEVAFGGQA